MKIARYKLTLILFLAFCISCKYQRNNAVSSKTIFKKTYTAKGVQVIKIGYQEFDKQENIIYEQKFGDVIPTEEPISEVNYYYNNGKLAKEVQHYYSRNSTIERLYLYKDSTKQRIINKKDTSFYYYDGLGRLKMETYKKNDTTYEKSIYSYKKGFLPDVITLINKDTISIKNVIYHNDTCFIFYRDIKNGSVGLDINIYKQGILKESYSGDPGYDFSKEKFSFNKMISLSVFEYENGKMTGELKYGGNQLMSEIYYEYN